uniref:Kininogen-1-like n=1 Tax=Erpetoichthys calabaricus TaxID=27687 RepID=A0A8C4SID9_ERPCA
MGYALQISSMKTLAALLICCSLSLIGALPLKTPTSCDNVNVQQGADLAIQRYNQNLNTSNQFALYQILEAMEAENGSEYSISITIKESNCPIGGGKVWTECDHLPDKVGIMRHCTANVYMAPVLEDSNVTISCDVFVEKPIIPVKAHCLGCPMDIDANNKDLDEPLFHAINKFNKENNYSNYFILSEVHKASRQVVAGIKFKMSFSIHETNCSKSDHPEILPECESKNTEISLFRRPPGITPFRSVIMPEETLTDNGNSQARKSNFWNTLRRLKRDEPKEIQSMEKSSEESEETSVKPSIIVPVVPNSDPIGSGPGPAVLPSATNSPASGHNLEPLELSQDLKPEVLPKMLHCPSKPWKRIERPDEINQQPSKTGDFQDSDLLLF